MDTLTFGTWFVVVWTWQQGANEFITNSFETLFDEIRHCATLQNESMGWFVIFQCWEGWELRCHLNSDSRSICTYLNVLFSTQQFCGKNETDLSQTFVFQLLNQPTILQVFPPFFWRPRHISLTQGNQIWNVEWIRCWKGLRFDIKTSIRQSRRFQEGQFNTATISWNWIEITTSRFTFLSPSFHRKFLDALAFTHKSPSFHGKFLDALAFTHNEIFRQTNMC